MGGGPRVRENEDGQIRSEKRAFIKAFAKRFRETETHSRNRFDRHRFNLFPSSQPGPGHRCPVPGSVTHLPVFTICPHQSHRWPLRMWLGGKGEPDLADLAARDQHLPQILLICILKNKRTHRPSAQCALLAV